MPAQANIIIAEDDAVLRDVYVKKFSLAGFQLRTVKNGQEAIDEITKQVPDLLILDLNMPILDGFGVLERFPREQRKFPVIVLTNFGDTKNKERSIELGADDFFIKSEMTIKTLLDKVMTLMKAREMWNK
ncbi:MAG: response regulator [Candidatus Peribacteraceae bacterium]|nr:response regulator [Candidatus Peribacteraceae bacterium]MDD5075353.1 response regulator [Candidatus Peribacteraceae bacterium]